MKAEWKPDASVLSELTLGQLLEVQAQNQPDHVCIVEPETGEQYTYREFYQLCMKIAAHLRLRGIEPGMHVAVYAKNSPRWVAVMFAAAELGAVFVPVNTNYKKKELCNILRHADVDAIFLSRRIGKNDFVEHLQGICPELAQTGTGGQALPRLRLAVYLDEGEPPEGMHPWSEFTADSGRAADQPPAPEGRVLCGQIASIQYTSGTTGEPKGAMLTHRAIVNVGIISGEKRRLGPEDRECIPLPFFHCFAIAVGITACIAHGSIIVVVDKFEALKTMRAVDRERCTSLLGVPTMFTQMLDHPQFSQFDFSCLRTGIVGGAPCTLPLAQRIVRDMYMREMVIGLGMTETAGLETMTDRDMPLERRIRSVGNSLPHVENKIIDPKTGASLGTGQVGEICTRGYPVMLGYYKNPEKTRQAIDRDGWLHTGDLCLREADGTFTLVGRTKDMIIHGGEKIYAKDLENYLAALPGIREVQVVGVKSDKYGEDVAAFLIAGPGCVRDGEAIRAKAKEELANYMVPQYVFFVDEMPVTASGKVQKYVLREWAESWLQHQTSPTGAADLSPRALSLFLGKPAG